MSKYHAKKVQSVDGLVFDSRLEMKRWAYLNELQDEGRIIGLRRQEKFELIPRQTEKKVVHLKTKDKVVERVAEQPVTYICDFVYFVQDEDGSMREVIEDTKGFRTPEYVIKRKLMRLQGHPVREIKKPFEEV